MIKQVFYNRVTQSFNAAAHRYYQYAGLQNYVMKELLNIISITQEDVILDLGCGTGRLKNLININNLIQLDRAFNMCQLAQGNCLGTINACMDQLPFISGSIDVIITSLILHWSQDLVSTLYEVNRVMCRGGRLYITIPVEGTFYEFNYILKSLDLPIIKFLSYGRLLTILKCCGFTLGSNEYVEHIEEYYDSFRSFIDSMKKNGTSTNRSGNFITKRMFSKISKEYEEKFAMDNKVKVSWDIAYVVAIK